MSFSVGSKMGILSKGDGLVEKLGGRRKCWKESCWTGARKGGIYFYGGRCSLLHCPLFTVRCSLFTVPLSTVLRHGIAWQPPWTGSFHPCPGQRCCSSVPASLPVPAAPAATDEHRDPVTRLGPPSVENLEYSARMFASSHACALRSALSPLAEIDLLLGGLDSSLDSLVR